MNEIIEKLLKDTIESVKVSKLKKSKRSLINKRKIIKSIDKFCSELKSLLDILLPLIKKPAAIKNATIQQIKNVIAKRKDKLADNKNEVINVLHSFDDVILVNKCLLLFDHTENIVKSFQADLLKQTFI